jgi:hypothetical protein
MMAALFLAAIYGAGVTLTGMGAWFGDEPLKERLFIVGTALTWPISLPIFFAIDLYIAKKGSKKH